MSHAIVWKYKAPNSEIFAKIWHGNWYSEEIKKLQLELLSSYDYNTVWGWTHVVTTKIGFKSKFKNYCFNLLVASNIINTTTDVNFVVINLQCKLNKL